MHPEPCSDPRPGAPGSALPKVPRRGDNSQSARQERLDFLARETGAQLPSLRESSFCEDQLASNLEAWIGAVELPVAVGGPLLFTGEHARGLIYAPLATSEGALVSSVTRGAFAVSLSGGVTTTVLAQRMVRAPMFLLADGAQARRFAQFAQDQLEPLRAIVGRHSNHARLQSIEPHLTGRAAHLVFSYETGDAAGQNMTTTCTWHACLWLVEAARAALGLDASEFIVEGGLSSDKKVSHANLLTGRGLRVQAEARVRRSAMQRVLKVDPLKLQRLWHYSASAAIGAGLTGLNTNVANVVAAIFAATGQDLASIHESAAAVLTLDVQPDGDVHVVLTMPSLVVGTVGGGTHLPDAHDGLELLGCRGRGTVRRLAEVIAGYALALDLSTMSAIAAGHFAIAHERMGRSQRERDFRLGELTPEFFQRLPGAAALPAPIRAAAPLAEVPIADSIVSELSARRLKRRVGLFPHRLTLADGGALDLMVKVKPTAAEMIEIADTVATLAGEPLAGQFHRCRHLMGTDASDRKELAIFAQTDERFTRHAPRCFGTWQDERRNAYVLVQELLSGLELMNSVHEVDRWTPGTTTRRSPASPACTRSGGAGRSSCAPSRGSVTYPVATPQWPSRRCTTPCSTTRARSCRSCLPRRALRASAS